VKKGHNSKNIHSRVMGLVGNDVEFDVEYILNGSKNATLHFFGYHSFRLTRISK
jgi:hypothetical protein